MKLLIIGAQGMLGHALIHIFKKHNPIGWDLADLDITQEKSTVTKIGELKADLIINAAAYTNVDKAEEEKTLAFKVNAHGVKNLVSVALATQAILVHYSTDYVFGQEKKDGYNEKAIPENTLNVYGQSKRKGEVAIIDAIQNKGLKAYLIRSSWLFGPDGKNFVQTILELYEAMPELKVVNDQWGKPTYTLDLAKATEELIDNNYHYGIYHLVNEPATNWYEFTKSILNIKYSNHINKKIIPVTSQKFPRPAKRPSCSILLNTKGPKMRPWREALEEYIK